VPKEILIRDMRDDDVPIVAGIEKMSFTFPWSETSFANEVHKLRSLPRVALVNDTIVGYICSEHVGDECHILNLAVHPDFRTRGIANTLVEHIVGELKSKECRFLYLEVRTSNDIAKKLYHDFGFRIVGTRKNYYVAPVEDAVIMMLEM
jgi:ribosomal-protein-alanine N-acetyltransferase